MINKAINKVILTILCIVLVISTSPFVSLGNEENDFYAQYSGSTSAGWGYTPNCTFTINKIKTIMIYEKDILLNTEQSNH